MSASERENAAVKRQQAFDAWLERKKEEQRVSLEKRAKEMAARRNEMEQQAMRRSVSRQAYQRWAKEKQEEDAILMKERQKEKELQCLKAEERGEQRRRAQESYQSWRSVKDEELKLQRHTAGEPLSTSPFPSRGCTPPLPGYCSVWSCDGNIATYMLQRVKRSNSRSV
ncbi:hypothetical protein EMCRGX_G022532 [Ephydatia muelleri]